MASSQVSRRAPIQRLPFEVKELIARELWDLDPYDQRSYQIDPSGDTFLGGHKYEWKPFPEASDGPQRSMQPVYDDLRALALVSKDFRDPAQRALFAIVVVGEPTTYFKLFRSLLESPELRSYIRCLFAIAVRNPDAEERRHEIQESRWYASIDILGPSVVSERFGELRNEDHFGSGIMKRQILQPHYAYLYYSIAFEEETSDEPSSRYPFFLSQILYGVIQLCPSLRALHLCGSHLTPGGLQEYPAFWMLDDLWPNCHKLLERHPFTNTLTVDHRVSLLTFRSLRYSRSKHMQSKVENVTIIGALESDADFRIAFLGTKDLFDWLRPFTNLKTLRIRNGFSFNPSYDRQNLNGILFLLKDTLERLVFDGVDLYLTLRSALLRDGLSSGQEDLFGPSGILSCLSEMRRLKHLVVPIHYIRRFAEGKAPLDVLKGPDQDQNVIQALQADVDFPKSLETAEVTVVEEAKFSPVHGALNALKVKTLHIDVLKGCHEVGKVVQVPYEKDPYDLIAESFSLTITRRI